MKRTGDLLLPITSFMLDAVLILIQEMTIKDDSINRHLKWRYLMKHFSKKRVKYLTTN